MPDQSSASTEHALMQEITAPLATLPDDALSVVADIDFPIVLRGYDRDRVDAYVREDEPARSRAADHALA